MNVVLKLSKLCNLRCSYCYEYEHLAERARMPLDGLAQLFASLADHLAAMPAAHVTFALHGGEPLLLPPAYLREVVRLQREHLGARGIAHANVMQTNLVRVPDGTIDLLAGLDIRLGVSLDLFGAARVDARGRDSDARVRRNLDALLAAGAAERVGVGGIAVLHAGNAARIREIFRFFAERGMDFRVLPMFALADAPARVAPLRLAPERLVAALLELWDEQLAWPGRRIRVEPVDAHFLAALRAWQGLPGAPYDPRQGEWALIVDTNGDTYTHSHAYDATHRLGNAFRQPVAALLQSDARQRLLALRARRAAACGRCDFGATCSRLPVVEAVASEARTDEYGMALCDVAQPVIAEMTRRLALLAPARAA